MRKFSQYDQPRDRKSAFPSVRARVCSLAVLAAFASGASATEAFVSDVDVDDGVAAALVSAAVAVQDALPGLVAGNVMAETSLADPAALADVVQPVADGFATLAAAEPQADAPALVALGFGPVADLDKLDQSRGGTDVHNDMKLDGVVSGNSAINVVTGSNTIDAGAFANMSGIPVVIQNSGANVLIQNATIVNLQFK